MERVAVSSIGIMLMRVRSWHMDKRSGNRHSIPFQNIVKE